MAKFIDQFFRFWMGILTSRTYYRYELGARSRIMFLNSVTLAGGVTIGAFSVLSLLTGNLPLGIACAIASVVVFANFLVIRAFKTFFAGGIVDCAVIFVFYYYLVFTGGEAGSGILWIMTYPLIALFLLGAVAGSLLGLVFGALVGFTIFSPALNAAKFSPLYSARVIGTYFFILLFSLIYELVRRYTLAKLQEVNTSLQSVTDELKAEKKQTDDILGGVEEGIFLLSKSLKLGDSHSKHLESLFETDQLSGANFLELMRPALVDRDFEAAQDFLDIMLAGNVSDELLAEINPLSEVRCIFQRAGGQQITKYLRFAFYRIGVANSAFPFLGVVADITDEVALKLKLEVEAREHRRAMESLFQIIHVDPVMMREFIADTEAELDAVNEIMRTEGAEDREILDSLYQSAHSIKGNAVLLGLDEFGIRVHEYESVVKKYREEGCEWRDLLSLTIGLGDIRKELDALKELIRKILSFQSDTKAAGIAEASLFQYSMEKLFKKESERTGIPATISVSGFGKRGVPDSHRKLVKDTLVQFIRNSFAHGFESSSDRIACGKSEHGNAELSVEWGADAYVVRYRDDGRGIDANRIRAKAKSLPEFAHKVDAMDVKEVAKLIFHPGFSTRDEVNLSAGRGIGMSLVRRRVTEAGGKLSVRSSPGNYVEFSVTLPITQAERRVS